MGTLATIGAFIGAKRRGASLAAITAVWTAYSGGTANAQLYTMVNGVLSGGSLDGNQLIWANGGKWYMELQQVGNATAGQGDFYFGFDPTPAVVNYTSAATIRLIVGSGWTWNKSMGGTSATADGSLDTALPVDGDVFGIAIDIDAAVMFAHKNGTWSTVSGEPGVGAGIAIAGGTDAYPVVASKTEATSSSSTVQLVNTGLYTPAGYTVIGT